MDAVGLPNIAVALIPRSCGSLGAKDLMRETAMQKTSAP